MNNRFPIAALKIFRQSVIMGGLAVLFIACLTACSETAELAPPPTVAMLFSTFTPRPTITPRPTNPPPATFTPTATPVLETVVIYDDGFAPGWKTEHSQFTYIEPQNAEYVLDGEMALKIVPRIEGSSTFLVTLDQSAGQIYRKDEILSLSFFLNPGPNIIVPEDLVVTMQGSNEFPYWVDGDDSVSSSGALNPFSETLLVFLDINLSIPPETWVEVELFLEDREFDPEYEFVTGFYIKNTLGFLQPYYIDRIEMTRIVKEKE